MPRCDSPRRRGALVLPGVLLAVAAIAPAWLGAPGSAQAQSPLLRAFPATALRGELLVTQPPEALLNQKPARLAPGARIRGIDNLLLLSGTVAGQRLVVHYTLDSLGQMLDVWVLSPAEMARRPWPTSAEQAAGWVFNADAQSWSPR